MKNLKFGLWWDHRNFLNRLKRDKDRARYVFNAIFIKSKWRLRCEDRKMVENNEDSPSDLIFFDTFSHDLHEVKYSSKQLNQSSHNNLFSSLEAQLGFSSVPEPRLHR